MKYIIENDFLQVKVISNGAEVVSIYNKKKEFEHIHNRDARFWSRSAPILFPNVGKYKNNQYRYNGKTYEQKQHGFLRDVDWSLLEQTKFTLSFFYESTVEDLKRYPFKFKAIVKYTLIDNKVVTEYKILNNDNKKMYFQLGGHPAYNLISNRRDSYFYFKDYDNFNRSFVNESGYYIDRKEKVKLDNGYLKMDDSLFLNDAIIIEDKNLTEIALCDEFKNVFLKFRSNALLHGLWIPNLDSPFVCIEPWCGRCDRDDFTGELGERDYEQVLDVNQEFVLKYEIEV